MLQFVTGINDNLIKIESEAMKDEEFLTTAEAVKLLRISRQTLHRFIRAGIITPRGAGKSNLFLKSELLDLLLNSKRKLAS